MATVQADPSPRGVLIFRALITIVGKHRGKEKSSPAKFGSASSLQGGAGDVESDEDGGFFSSVPWVFDSLSLSLICKVPNPEFGTSAAEPEHVVRMLAVSLH